MLVVTRTEDEEVRIGDDIRIVVIAITGKRIRLGIEAPREVPIFRSELLPVNEEKKPGKKKGGDDVTQ